MHCQESLKVDMFIIFLQSYGADNDRTLGIPGQVSSLLCNYFDNVWNISLVTTFRRKKS